MDSENITRGDMAIYQYLGENLLVRIQSEPYQWDDMICITGKPIKDLNTKKPLKNQTQRIIRVSRLERAVNDIGK